MLILVICLIVFFNKTKTLKTDNELFQIATEDVLNISNFDSYLVDRINSSKIQCMKRCVLNDLCVSVVFNSSDFTCKQ